MSEIISEIKRVSLDSLQRLCIDTLVAASHDVVSLMPATIEESSNLYIERLNQLFETIRGDLQPEGDADIDFSNLSVIVGDELDVVMTVNRMVTAARKKHLPQFAKLSVRINTLLDNIKFNESNNPLDPEQLFTAFTEALRPLNLQSNKSVAILKLYDSILVSELGTIINEANQLLINAGVLPDIGLGDDSIKKTATVEPDAGDHEADDSTRSTAETALVSATIDRIQDVALQILKEQCGQVLFGVDSEIFPLIWADRDDAAFRFTQHIKSLFKRIKGDVLNSGREIDFDSLSLILEDELDVVMATEGMVAAARNRYLPQFVNFNARMNELLESSQLNELNNPLDPDQLFSAFKEAIRPFGITGERSLRVFRMFNSMVIGELESLMIKVNQILIDENILPDLDLQPIPKVIHGAARTSPRSISGKEVTSNYGLPTSDLEDKQKVGELIVDDEDDNPELFAMVQSLMHGDSPAPTDLKEDSARLQSGGAPQTRPYVVPDELLTPRDLVSEALLPASDQTVEVLDPHQLQNLLSNIQSQLSQLSQISAAKGEHRPTQVSYEPNIKATLAGLLKERQTGGVINAVDRQSSDAINLVELLYEAIWNDDAVPIPIKELIGRTQITVVMVVLSDTSFFNRVNHPVRALLNEFANAGIGWSEVENLEEDSLYQKISSTVQYILSEYKGQEGFFEDLLADFRAYRAREAARGKRLEQRIKHTREGEARAEFARKLVTQRIEERILGREVAPFVKEFIAQDFHKFMVLLVLKEGPGSKAWKQAVNTIDVLLWSVQPHDHPGDKTRLETINPRLMSNLKRALRIASLEADMISEKLDMLERIQLESFPAEVEKVLPMEEILGEEEVVRISVTVPEKPDTIPPAEPPAAEEVLAEDDPCLKQVDEFGVGTWFEFLIEGDQHVRCKLAARINAIDKLIFVNRQGVKVIEKTRMGLAIELKNESVKVISDGLLFTRALESVIGNLRESQAMQQAPT